MYTQKNKETEILYEENIGIINRASFDPHPFLFPSSDFNPNSSYMSCGVLVPQQLHQTGYRNLFSAMPVESAAFLHCGFNDSFCSLSRSTSDTKLRPFEQLVATSDVPLLGNEGILCSRVPHQCSNSLVGTTEARTHIQSRVTVACKKQRIRWTGELHKQFVEAVNRLGGAAKATPKRILKLMKYEGLTIFHIKSHLQKYRTVKYFTEDKNGMRVNGDGMPMFDKKRNGELHILEALRLQMDVQKSLHEHLKLQRNLQIRIEEHAKCLQRMFDQQNKSNIISEKHNLKNDNYPSSIMEQSSTRNEDCLDFYTGEAEESNFII